MKRYMVLWGALFFLVMFTSLYLMMETVTNQPPGFAKTQVMENIVAYPSLQSHQASLQLTQPLFPMPRNSAARGGASFLPQFSPLATPLPCELHLVNFRTMQNRDDDANVKYIPKESAAFLVHHLGSDCDFPLYGASCHVSDGKVTFSQLFADLKMTQTEETSLTLMHSVKSVDGNGEYHVPPMEIKTFKTTLL